jgi:hypothetical protein
MTQNGVVKTPSSSAKKNRNTYTIKEKIAIRRYKRAGSSSINDNPVSLSNIRTWFIETYNKEISISTIRDIISPKWDMLDNELSPLLLKSKTVKRPVWPLLEAALNEWIMYAGKGFNLDPTKDEPDQEDLNVIRQKAEFLLTKLNHVETPISSPNWKDDWCRKFYDNWKFLHYNQSGVDRANDTDDEDTFADIRNLYLRYPLQDRFTCDHMVIRPGTLPGKCFWMRSVSAKQLQTVLNRTTSVLLCCNADGSEKLPLLTVDSNYLVEEKPLGTSVLSESSKFKNDLLDIDHVIEFLRQFDSKMSFRKVALLMNNSYTFKKAVEKIKNSDHPLENVEVFWIPMNNYYRAQPLSDSVLSMVKERVRYKYLKELKSCYEMNDNPLLKLGNNTRLFSKWLDESWENASSTSISASFEKFGLANKDEISNIATSEDLTRQKKNYRGLCENLLKDLVQKGVFKELIGLDEYLNPTDEKKAAIQEDEDQVLAQIIESYKLKSLLKNELDQMALEKKDCEFKVSQKEALGACQKLGLYLSNISNEKDIGLSLKNEILQLITKWECLQATATLSEETEHKVEKDLDS